jgi:peptidoglycan/LPS O-acetylase OafA/YrhL
VRRFLIKRCLRIYPAFAMASIISVFVFAPLGGGWALFSDYTCKDCLKIPVKILILDMPWVDGAFGNISLNIPLWTIKWEFLCYLSMPILSMPILAYLGLHKR